MNEKLILGADVININSLQETYPHPALLNWVTYCHGNIKMIIGQDVFHAICFRLPKGWVFSGLLPSSSILAWNCFKANMEQVFELTSLIKSWHNMKSYGALKQIDPRSAANSNAQEILENTPVHNRKKNIDIGMVRAEIAQ